jgi:hypothetical protein
MLVAVMSSALVVLVGCVTGANVGSTRSRIRYVTASDETNDKAVSYIKELFGSNIPTALLPKAVMCGPYLWKELVDDMGFDRNAGIPLTLMDPRASDKKLEGRIVRWADQTSKLQHALIDIFLKSGYLRIRHLTGEEVTVYWKMNAWDITEPVFMLETAGHLILIDLEEGEVFYLEDLFGLVKQ